jgi:hypothetical protein
MRFGAYLPLLSVLSGVFAAPVNHLQPRDTRVILASITTITKALQDENTALTALARNPNSKDVVSALISKAHAVTGELRNAASSIAAGPSVDLVEGLTLVMPLNSITTTSDAAINAWGLAKSTIVKSGGKDQVLDILREQSVAAEKFADAMVGKIPELYKYIGREYGDHVSKKLRGVIEQFRAA